jgi:hypothetical protein
MSEAMKRPSDSISTDELLEWAAENGHLYDKPGPVPERVLKTLREGKTLRDLYDEAHGLASRKPGKKADEE